MGSCLIWGLPSWCINIFQSREEECLDLAARASLVFRGYERIYRMILPSPPRTLLLPLRQNASQRLDKYLQGVKRSNTSTPWEKIKATGSFVLMHTQKYVTLRGDFSIGRMRKGYGNFCGKQKQIWVWKWRQWRQHTFRQSHQRCTKTSEKFLHAVTILLLGR